MKEKQEFMIKISKFFIPYIILLIIIGFKGKIFISFIFVFLHEFIHYTVAKKLGFKGFGIEILPIGAALNLEDLDDAEPKEDLIISASGPLFNLFFALFVYLVNIQFQNYYLELIYITNLALGIFNLIPVFPLDGGRILRDILSFKMIYKRANKITVKISIMLGFIISLCFFIMMFFGRRNLTLGIMGIFIIISSYKEKERIVYLIMGDIVKKKYKFIKKGYIENRSLSIYYKKNLLDALSIVDKNKYNIFIVLNDDMKAINMIYEGELVEALKIYGNISIEEYLKTTDEVDKMDKFVKATIREWKDWKKGYNKDT